MRERGILAKWNAERGFGFIKPDVGSADVFVHVSAFPRDGVPPQVGESISFERMQQADGKARGVSIIRPGVAPPVHRRPSGPPRSARYGRAPGKLTSSFTSIVARMAVLGVGVFLASTYAKWSTLLSPVEPMKQPADAGHFSTFAVQVRWPHPLLPNVHLRRSDLLRGELS
jgi:cold shock CspA family protein